MRNKSKPSFPIVINLDNVETFQGYLITWFADVATTYLINMRLSPEVKNKAEALCQEADNYISTLKEKHLEICGRSPVPLTQNDKEELFDLCKAVESICDYSRGKRETYRLQPALSLEFTEYIRSFMPRVSTRTLKRNLIGVESILQGLAVIGARISRAYLGEESGYVFIDVPNPEAVDYRKLSGMAVEITRSINSNEGGRLSLLVGVASAIALVYRDTLKELAKKSQVKVNFVRLTRTGNKTVMKAFEILDLSSLASRIYSLGIASPIYSLTSRYPPKEKRVLRSFIERLSRAIIICELLNDYTEMYAVLRSLPSENLLSELKGYENWERIVDSLLKIRIQLW